MASASDTLRKKLINLQITYDTDSVYPQPVSFHSYLLFDVRVWNKIKVLGNIFRVFLIIDIDKEF